MDEPIEGSLVSERLFEWLDFSGESISEVAEKIQTSRTTLSNLLNGHIQHPRLTTVRKLARHFGVSVEEFLSGPKSARAVGNELAALSPEMFMSAVAIVAMHETNTESAWPTREAIKKLRMQDVRAWMNEHGFTVDDLRRAVVRMDPLSFRRILRSTKLQEKREEEYQEALYTRLQREGFRHGDIDATEMGRNIARFGGVA